MEDFICKHGIALNYMIKLLSNQYDNRSNGPIWVSAFDDCCWSTAEMIMKLLGSIDDLYNSCTDDKCIYHPYTISQIGCDFDEYEFHIMTFINTDKIKLVQSYGGIYPCRYTEFNSLIEAKEVLNKLIIDTDITTFKRLANISRGTTLSQVSVHTYVYNPISYKELTSSLISALDKLKQFNGSFIENSYYENINPEGQISELDEPHLKIYSALKIKKYLQEALDDINLDK